jgi:glycine/D-amino acid oxidase-like deaminating enzyme
MTSSKRFERNNKNTAVDLPFFNESMPALAGDTGADVCVIGASFVGLRTAYDLLCNGKSVIVIEASPSLPREREREEDAHSARMNDLLTGAGAEEQAMFDHAAPATSSEMANEIVRLGGRIHGATPAFDVYPDHNMQVVTTPRGAIVARVVVMATSDGSLGKELAAEPPPSRARQRQPSHNTSFSVYAAPADERHRLITPLPYHSHPKA